MNPFSHVSHISNPEFWNKKTVLVAGGTGFLGGWIVRRLLDHGARVIAIVRKPRPGSHFYLRGYDRKAEVVIGDIADIGLVRGIFKKNPDISVFFHAAYGGDVNTVLKEPLECFRAAAQSTWEILDLLRLEHPECISVISSSDKAYGSQSLPYRETSPLMPMHPYEVAKSSQDLAAQSYGKTYGLPVAVTRCGNYYGAYDFNFSRLIPGVMKDLAEGRQPVLRSNGRFTRDFLYIEDAAEVQLMLAERLAEDPALYGEAFNFSYEVELEVIDIVRRLAELTGQAIEPVVNNSVRAEIPHMRLSTEKATNRLGWKPRFSFDEGLKRSVKWYLEHFRKNAAAYLVGHFSLVGKASELVICGI